MFERMRALLALFIIIASLIILFGVMSQPFGIITGVFKSAYPAGGSSVSAGNELDFVKLAFAATIIIGILFAIFWYAFINNRRENERF